MGNKRYIVRLSDVDKKEIETQVTALLKGYGYSPQEDAYVDIVEFVQQLGFIVGNAELDEKEDGFLAIQANDKIIGVNSKRSLDWKRFIIAHEFAHFVLHYKAGELYLNRENKKGKDEEENDADYFAAALLMPNEAFKRLYLQFEKDGMNKTANCLQLASIFKVPFDSASRRVEEVF